MDYVIAICSHNRSEELKAKTLAMLHRYGISSEKIYVFVAPEEMDQYQRVLPGVQIVQGATGLSGNRRAASLFFPEGTPVFCLDDDVKRFVVKSSDNRLTSELDLHALILKGFQMSKDRGASLWSVYPVPNAKWLKQSVTEGLVFCYGCAYGVWNCHDTFTELSFKDDVERSLKFYERDGSVLRLNWVAPVQTYLKGKGGLNESRTYDKEVSGCMKLQARFPTLVTLRHKKNRVDLVFPRRLCKTLPLVDAYPRSLRRRSDASATSVAVEDDSEKSEGV